jgi:hypothetical protein
MPTLKDFRKVVEVTLPSFPDSKVEVYQGILVRDLGGINSTTIDGSVETILKILPKVIKSWNFTDDKGEPLAITVENIGLLQAVDLKVIADASMPSVAEKKS